ncbi:transporter [Alcaligenes phenolicus]
MKVNQFAKIGTAITVAAMAVSAHATEGGLSMYPAGAEAYNCCALPPPGNYAMMYYQNYQANKAVDNSGTTVTPSDFKVRADAMVSRFIWVSEETVLGASPVVHTIVPIVNMSVKMAPGISQRKTGLGDITIGAGLGWHHDEKLHTLLALDLFMPTGSYRQ